MAKGNLTSAVFSPEQKKGGLNRVKIPLLIVGVFLTLSATSQAGPHGSGFGSGGFRGGFVARNVGRTVPHGCGFSGGGFHSRFVDRSVGPAFRMGHGFHRDFANRGFFCRDHRVLFQQFVLPVYGYYDPLAYSYLEPDSDYQYWDNSAPSVQPRSFRGAVDHGPIVVVINSGNSRPMDSSSNAGYVNSGYVSSNAAGQQRMVVRDPNEKTGSRTDPMTSATPAVAQATPAAAQTTQTTLQPEAGVFGKLILVSWLYDDGKDVIFVKNIETNDVQRITSQPNIDNFRIVEIHPNADPKQFEAIISNGFEQGPVRFRF